MKNIFLLSFLLGSNMLFSQSSWTHVGPFSDNNIPTNVFETAQLDNITIDPSNSSHLFASGWYAGLWESTDGGANWSAINNTITGTNGVSAITFLNSTSILVGNYHPTIQIGGIHQDYSTGIWTYNFTSHLWNALGAFPNPGGIPYTIKSIACYPASTSILFASTTLGLFRSSDGGASWGTAPVVSGCIENIVFVPNLMSSNNIYLAGSNLTGDHITPRGTLMVKESTDGGLTFPTDISSSIVIPSPYNVRSHTRICYGKTDPISHVAELYLFSMGTNGVAGSDPYGWDAGNTYLHKLSKNIFLGTMTVTSLTPSGSGASYGSPSKYTSAYDPVNNGVWFGSISLSFYNASTTSIEVLDNIHDDMHDIKFAQTGASWDMYVACDGGVYKTAIPLFTDGIASHYVNFNTINNKLNVCLVNGFSGTDDDEDLYLLGCQDIRGSDIYDSQTQTEIYHRGNGENDGGLIDKFNKSNMFLDVSSYAAQSGYRTSITGGSTVTGVKSYYWPDFTSSSFQKGGEIEGVQEGSFTSRLFFQDPYRPQRIFHAKIMNSILQYDYATSTFVDKIWMGDIEPHPGDFGIVASSAYPVAMSFSPETINSLYFVLDGASDSRPTVVKYVGKNLEDCWRGHNSNNYVIAGVTYPQWATLTAGLWESLSISASDMAGIKFHEIETSPFNKDVIYILIYVPNHPDIKVLKYNGTTWTNYTTGLPNTEIGLSMIMDRQSYDGIYLSTDKGAYYRNPSSTQWVSYTSGLPIISSKQMEINYAENTVRAGTYGRGIWKSPLQCPPSGSLTLASAVSVSKFVERDGAITTSETYSAGLNTLYRSTTEINLVPGFSNTATTNSNFSAYIHSCTSGANSFKSLSLDDVDQDVNAEKINNDLPDNTMLYPNPNDGSFTLNFIDENSKEIYVYDALGRAVYHQDKITLKQLEVDISNKSKGVYVVKIIEENEVKTIKFISQ